MLSEDKFEVKSRSIFCRYPKQAKEIVDGLTKSGLVLDLNQTEIRGGTCVEYSFNAANGEQITACLNKILDAQIQQITGVKLDRV